MVVNMPKRAYYSKMRLEGFDYHKLEWKINRLFGAACYRTALTDILGPDLCVDKPFRICLKEIPYMGWIGSWQWPEELREQIVETQGYKNIDKDNVLLSHGTALANSVVFMQSLDWNTTKNDEAILFNPTWFQFNILRKGFGVKATALSRKENNGWRIDMEELKEAITPKTKLIMLNTPNNPTGQTLSHQEMKALCEIADDHGVRVLSDELYRGLEYGPNTDKGEFSADWEHAFTSPAVVNYSENAVSTASLSKTCGLVGAKIGWLASQDKEILQKCYDLMGYMMLHLNLLGKLVATAATYPPKYKEILMQKRKHGAESWKAVYEWIEKSDVFSWKPPQGGFLSFPRYNINISAKELNNRLIAEYNTWMQPGYPDYGVEYHMRLGVGRNTADDTRRSLEALGKLCEKLKKEDLGPQVERKEKEEKFVYR